MKKLKYILILSLFALVAPNMSFAENESGEDNDGLKIRSSVDLRVGDRDNDDNDDNEDDSDSKYNNNRSGDSMKLKSEAKIDLRNLDLKNKLWKMEKEDRMSEYKEAKERYHSASDSNKSIYKSEFRKKFVERFSHAFEKLSDFQNRMNLKLETESNAGVDVSKARIKLEESVSFMVVIRSDADSLQNLLAEDVADSNKEARKEEVKVLVDKLKTNIKASHDALKQAFKELRTAKGLHMESSVDVTAER